MTREVASLVKELMTRSEQSMGQSTNNQLREMTDEVMVLKNRIDAIK